MMFEKNSSFVLYFPSDIHSAALLFLFFTDSEFTSQENYLCFFVVVVTVLLPLLVFLLLKTAGNRLDNARHNEKIRLIHCFC
jgi:hypothetical protein